ncbi:MAG: Crp/Fnr family transcriptional regulator [Caldimicrobium sp.]
MHLIDLLEKSYSLEKVKRGTLLFSEGGLCAAVPFLKEGKLKVYLISESGREITLYSVLPGQMCILAMITAYSKSEYPAYTRAEENSYLYMIPSKIAVKWLDENHWWRSLFMKVLSENFLNIMSSINSMVSTSVKERLIKYLLTYYEKGNIIEKTHENIAKDVGSVRVVVSRVLKELEKEGLIKLCRRKLFIKDYESLKRRAEALANKFA